MNKTYLVGTCTQMCPDEEILRRQKDKRIHILEIPDAKQQAFVLGNKNFVVKEFSRSAAGKAFTPKELRTRDSLLYTVHYLLHNIISTENVPWDIVYDFIQDRLKSVRQDMIIQNFSRANIISLLQPMIKFYVYAAYRLCDNSKFDATENNLQLQECLKRLLGVYDDIDKLKKRVSAIEQLKDDQNLLYLHCRPFMEALYLISNLGNTVAMERFYTIPNMWKTYLVKKCYKMSLDYWKRNYVRLCRNIATLPALLAATMVLHLPIIREKALESMSIAYSSNNANFPVSTLQNLLFYDKLDDVLNDCRYYSIPVDEHQNVFFNRYAFYNSQPELPQPKHVEFVDGLLAKHTLSYFILQDNLEAWVNHDGTLSPEKEK